MMKLGYIKYWILNPQNSADMISKLHRENSDPFSPRQLQTLFFVSVRHSLLFLKGEKPAKRENNLYENQI